MSIPDMCQEAARRLIAEGWEEGSEASEGGALHITLTRESVRLGIKGDKYGVSMIINIEGAIPFAEITLHSGGRAWPELIVAFVNAGLARALEL